MLEKWKIIRVYIRKMDAIVKKYIFYFQIYNQYFLFYNKLDIFINRSCVFSSFAQHSKKIINAQFDAMLFHFKIFIHI